MAPAYYNMIFQKEGRYDIYCEYFNLPQVLDKKVDHIILKISTVGEQNKCEFLLINSGNTFPHIHIRVKLKITA